MTCYFRHLKAIFEKAGINITQKKKSEIDKAIHSIVSVKYKNCSGTWKEVKNRLAEDEEAFITNLKEALNSHM